MDSQNLSAQILQIIANYNGHYWILITSIVIGLVTSVWKGQWKFPIKCVDDWIRKEQLKPYSTSFQYITLGLAISSAFIVSLSNGTSIQQSIIDAALSLIMGIGGHDFFKAVLVAIFTGNSVIKPIDDKIINTEFTELKSEQLVTLPEVQMAATVKKDETSKNKPPSIPPAAAILAMLVVIIAMSQTGCAWFKNLFNSGCSADAIATITELQTYTQDAYQELVNQRTVIDNMQGIPADQLAEIDAGFVIQGLTAIEDLEATAATVCSKVSVGAVLQDVMQIIADIEPLIIPFLTKAKIQYHVPLMMAKFYVASDAGTSLVRDAAVIVVVDAQVREISVNIVPDASVSTGVKK
jgi:hypothetical protein